MKTNMTETWSAIPKGLCFIRMFHEPPGKHVLHACLKVNDGPWYNQAHVPFHSQGVPGYEEFWRWVEQNMPIWDYPETVRGHR